MEFEEDPVGQFKDPFSFSKFKNFQKALAIPDTAGRDKSPGKPLKLSDLKKRFRSETSSIKEKFKGARGEGSNRGNYGFKFMSDADKAKLKLSGLSEEQVQAQADANNRASFMKETGAYAAVAGFKTMASFKDMNKKYKIAEQQLSEKEMLNKLADADRLISSLLYVDRQSERSRSGQQQQTFLRDPVTGRLI